MKFKDYGLNVFSVDEVFVFLVAAAVVAALQIFDERMAQEVNGEQETDDDLKAEEDVAEELGH